jgi:DNA primase
MIPDDQVEEVRARADIVEVVGELVPLKKSGKEYKARCPFHEERTPSFYVVPDKGFYNCFGCGENGDVFSFVMKRLGLDFVEAVKHVAAKAGVEIRETGRGEAEEDPHRHLYELNAFARDVFRRSLEDPAGGREARDYLESRGVDAETAERYGLGFAPDDWRALRDAATTHGYDDEDLLEAGLLTTSEKAPEPYDRFRNRIIFPIERLDGRVVAFGGRILGSKGRGPKYLNSPETPVYHKGEVLYGLSWAKNAIRREGAAVVVEGYMDLVTLGAAGLDHTVATLGTAMTSEHARLLSRYTRRVHLLFDSDEAGLRATFKAGDILLAAGLRPAVTTLPPGEDPDTLVRKEGGAGLRHHLELGVDLLDRKLQILDEHGYFDDIEKTRAAVDRLLPTLRAAADPTLRDIYVARVSERTGVKRETLEAEVERGRERSRGRSSASGSPRTGTRRRRRHGNSGAGRSLPGLGPERTLLLLMLKDRSWLERAGERLGPEDFEEPVYRTIFRTLLDHPEMEAAPPEMDPPAATRVEELLSDTQEIHHGSRVFDEVVARIRLQALARTQAEIEERLLATDDPEERAELTREKIRISRQRREIGPDMSHWARKAQTLSDPSKPR